MNGDSRAVFRDIQRLARDDYGGNTGALVTVYAVEGLLRRLAASPYATRMVLKGGMLMAAMSARRMTKDADLSTDGVSNDEERVRTMVAKIATIELPEPDGLVYDAGAITTQTMREDADYHSVRVKIPARLGTAKATATLDLSFGDFKRSTVVDLPELLGGSIRLESYPLDMVLSEKIETMMSRGELNTRDRDFADVWILSRLHSISADGLFETLHAVAGSRSHTLVPLADALRNLPDRQVSYQAMLNRMSYQRVLPSVWKDLVADVVAFVDPLLGGLPGMRWDASAAAWM